MEAKGKMHKKENRAPDNGSTWRIYDAKSAQRNGKKKSNEKKRKEKKRRGKWEKSRVRWLQAISINRK